jgi:hypothetical protein
VITIAIFNVTVVFFSDCFHIFVLTVLQAETYLRLMKNFSELGFSRDRIKDVLITSDLDEEKSLDLLIGSS